MGARAIVADHDGLITQQIPRLRRYARALTGDRSAADDLVQDTLERAWTKLHLYRRGTDLRAWLFTVMHNVHVNRVPRAGRATRISDNFAHPAHRERALKRTSHGRPDIQCPRTQDGREGPLSGGNLFRP